MTQFQGRPEGAGRRLCLVVSRFNQIVTSRLEEEARRELLERGVREEDIDVIYVPGAWELTAGVRKALSRGYDGVVALGCVVRGETSHFDYICQATVTGLVGIEGKQDKPIGFGLLTTDNLAQALERADGQTGNQGASAARAALEMCDLFDQLG